MLSLVKHQKIDSIFQSLVAIFTILLFGNCADLDRTNPLDPQNPDSKSTKIVLVEAFVSQGTGQPYNDYALQALDKLSQTYNSRAIIIEYHVQAVNGEDPLATENNLTRYHDYVPDPQKRASPDVFFDGKGVNVQGASSSNIVYERYEEALTNALNSVSYVIIEPKAELLGNTFSIKVRVACLGSSAISNVTLYWVIIEDLDESGKHRIVRELLPVEAIGTLEPGEIKNLERQFQIADDISNGNIRAVLFAQDTLSGSVLQATWVEF